MLTTLSSQTLLRLGIILLHLYLRHYWQPSYLAYQKFLPVQFFFALSNPIWLIQNISAIWYRPFKLGYPYEEEFFTCPLDFANKSNSPANVINDKHYQNILLTTYFKASVTIFAIYLHRDKESSTCTYYFVSNRKSPAHIIFYKYYQNILPTTYLKLSFSILIIYIFRHFAIRIHKLTKLLNKSLSQASSTISVFRQCPFTKHKKPKLFIPANLYSSSLPGGDAVDVSGTSTPST